MATDYTKWVQLGLTRWDAYIPRKKSKMAILLQAVLTMLIMSSWVIITAGAYTLLCMIWN